MAYKMTFSDGSSIGELGLNGNNWTSKKKLTEEMFAGKMGEVHITGNGEAGELDEVWHHCELVQIRKCGKEWWAVLRELTPEELAQEKIRGDIAYIAMMADIELED